MTQHPPVARTGIRLARTKLCSVTSPASATAAADTRRPVRHLLRASNRRSAITAKGANYLKAVLSAAPILGIEYATPQGSLLLRVSGKLGPSVADQYQPK
jgi:hypothetical protein